MKTSVMSNQAKCNGCGDIIFSSHVHDYVTCSCGRISVDGGNDYLRRSGDLSFFEEMAVVYPTNLKDAIVEAAEWCLDTERNELGIAYAVARAIRDAGYKVVKMNRRRYNYLQMHPEDALTPTEVSEGWHFCPEWDFMLINKSWPEYEACTCRKEVSDDNLSEEELIKRRSEAHKRFRRMIDEGNITIK